TINFGAGSNISATLSPIASVPASLRVLKRFSFISATRRSTSIHHHPQRDTGTRRKDGLPYRLQARYAHPSLEWRSPQPAHANTPPSPPLAPRRLETAPASPPRFPSKYLHSHPSPSPDSRSCSPQ